MELRQRLPGAGRHVDAARPFDELEPARLDHPREAGLVGIPPPGPPAGVQRRDRQTRQEEGQRQVDAVDDDHRAVAHGPETFERPDRVTQVDEQASQVDEVEPPHVGLVDVVDAALEALDRGAELAAG